MALTFLKNVKVEKAFSGGRGYAVSENFKKGDGSDGSSRWVVWFDQATTLAEGSTVDVSGLHSDKIKEFTNDSGEQKIYVERTLNSARLGSSDSAQSNGDGW